MACADCTFGHVALSQQKTRICALIARFEPPRVFWGTGRYSRLGYNSAMFKIILQAEEQALLDAIRDGLCPVGTIPDPILLRYTALRMITVDERGCPRLTDLGEAALARMRGKIH